MASGLAHTGERGRRRFRPERIEVSAIQELEQQGMQVVSIIKLEHILEYLAGSGDLAEREAIEIYRARYGID